MADETRFDPESHMTGYQWGFLVNDAFEEPLWASSAFAAGLSKITDLIAEGRGTAEVREIQQAIIDARHEFEDRREERASNE